MADQISISATFVVGKKKDFQIDVNGKKVRIPVDEAVFVNFQNQFKTNTTPQRQRRKTLENVVRAAYLHGLHQSHPSS
jgi:hypothetical protein